MRLPSNSTGRPQHKSKSAAVREGCFYTFLIDSCWEFINIIKIKRFNFGFLRYLIAVSDALIHFANYISRVLDKILRGSCGYYSPNYAFECSSIYLFSLAAGFWLKS